MCIRDRPNLVVTDLDMLREILVKKFNYFADRVSDRATNVSVMSTGGTIVSVMSTWSSVSVMSTVWCGPLLV